VPDRVEARGTTYRYVPVSRLAQESHIVVDGAPRPGTVCTLSHWPGTPTPVELWHDVSAGIVQRAVARPSLLPDDVDAVTVDHYDADGVIALAVLCVEGLASDHGPLLVEAARAGDFDVVTVPGAAVVAFALGALGDTDRAAAALGVSPPSPGVDRTAWSVTRALSILPGLVDDPDRYAALWSDERAAFDVSTRGLSEDWVTVEDRPEHDLAVVRVDQSHPDANGARWHDAPVHRAALHSGTECMRVATVVGGRVEIRYRYESWVRMQSRRPRPRVDLDPVAAELTKAEGAGARWVFDGAGAITGALHLADATPSTLDPEDVLDRVCSKLDILDAGPPAWDPYAAPVRGG
jgi:hypothetical protein